MYYVYVLYSKKDKKMYTGCIQDLRRRLDKHNAGKVISTINRIPFILIYYEAYVSKKDAFKREKWLKSGWGRNHLSKSLSDTLENFAGKNVSRSKKTSRRSNAK